MSTDAPRRGPWLFGVDVDRVQLTWRHLGPGPLEVTVRPSDGRGAPVDLHLELGHGPGSAHIGGLEPDREVTISVDAPGRGRWRRRVRTLAPPPGPELYRFATISDLHLGEQRFGLRGRLSEPEPGSEPYAVRAARAAVDEIEQWGAELLVAKGDLTDTGRQADWDCFGRLVAGRRFALLAIPGNHDTWEPPRSLAHPWRGTRHDPTAASRLSADQARQRLGLPTDPVQVLDVPGLRVVAADTTRPDRRSGWVAHRSAEVAEAAAQASGPVFVVLHHQLMTTRVPTHLPVGIARAEADPFLDALAQANPAGFVTSGHTHRHRRRDHGPLVVTEVGSTKDYPGTWAGYVVHAGGIRQVVWRVCTPDVLAWTDRSAAAALGAWGRWSPGRLPDRCFAHRWPRR